MVKSKMQKILLIVPFGNFEHNILIFLENELSQRLGFKIQITNPEPVPSYAYNVKRKQYYSSIILKKLLKLKSTGKEYILGVVDIDLYVPQLNFVFGEADANTGICIISLVRLQEEFYSLSPSRSLFFERTLKEAIHELGHTFGLGHCKHPSCIMYFSNSLLDTDNKGPDFCLKCKTRLNQYGSSLGL